MHVVEGGELHVIPLQAPVLPSGSTRASVALGRDPPSIVSPTTPTPSAQAELVVEAATTAMTPSRRALAMFRFTLSPSCCPLVAPVAPNVPTSDIYAAHKGVGRQHGGPFAPK